ncbi:MAG: sigma-70 family RNA polymerase sigma factor [Phycisphaeraceae bacterium]
MSRTSDSNPPGPSSFALTRWSVVLAAGGSNASAAKVALASLCEAYWYPLYAFVRRRGFTSPEAQDLVQGFFVRLLEKNDFIGLDPERGRFRAFLLACLKHFISNERDRDNALKRGGGKRVISFDAGEAEERYRLEPPDDATPERLFERRWAIALLDQAMNTLRQDYTKAGSEGLFDRLKSQLTDPGDVSRHADIAGELNMTEAAVKKAAQRLRQRYREVIRTQIEETVATPEEVEDEIRDLFAALAD